MSSDGVANKSSARASSVGGKLSAINGGPKFELAARAGAGDSPPAAGSDFLFFFVNASSELAACAGAGAGAGDSLQAVGLGAGSVFVPVIITAALASVASAGLRARFFRTAGCLGKGFLGSIVPSSQNDCLRARFAGDQLLQRRRQRACMRPLPTVERRRGSFFSRFLF